MTDYIFKIIEKVFRVEKRDVIKLIRESIAIFLVSAIIGFFINMFHPKGYTFVGSAMFKDKQIVMISSEEAKIKIDTGAAVIIDTRTTEEYNAGHIPGAVHVPGSPESLREKRIKENFSLLGGQQELLLYCDGEACGSSSILSKRLLEMGYPRHIYIIENGMPEWQAKGYPVEKNGGAK